MTKLIKLADLELLFSNQLQREAFMRIMTPMLAIDPVDYAIVVDVNDHRPVIIQRNGKQIYSDFD